MARNHVTVVTYHTNGEVIELQFSTLDEARTYMDIALRERNVTECEWFA